MTSVALAATDTFRITTLVGDDVTPPTTPTILSATAIAPTQIDISWSTSTDNFSFGGYRLFRDGIQIATTTLKFFSDTGLTPSTTYVYTVNAFDSFYNTSTTSDPATTTTPALPTEPVVTETTTRTGSYIRPELRDFEIDPSLRSARFTFTAQVPISYSLRWGRNSAYDGGFVVSDIYRHTQQTVITDLEPATLYQYELIGYDGAGRAWPLKTGTFTTDTPPDSQPPFNVLNLTATVEGSDVVLRWINPPNSDFAYVRVMRSYLFYPTDPSDGFFRYEGSDNVYRDISALSEYDRQFYTVFAYDHNGNVSSGAVVSVSRSNLSLGGDGLPSQPTIYEPPAPENPVEEAFTKLRARDITLKQNDRLYTLDRTDITLYRDDSITVSVPYGAVPEHLKSIVVDFFDASDKRSFQSFLLRINKDKTAYEAVIPALALEDGVLGVTIHVFDHLYQDAHSVSGQVTMLDGTGVTQESAPLVIFPDLIVSLLKHWLPYLLVVLLFLFFILFRRRDKDEDEA